MRVVSRRWADEVSCVPFPALPAAPCLWVCACCVDLLLRMVNKMGTTTTTATTTTTTTTTIPTTPTTPTPTPTATATATGSLRILVTPSLFV